jgi:plastocyanin
MRPLLAAVALALVLTGCGKDSVDAGPPVTTKTIKSLKTAFDVKAFAVNAGTKVTVTYVNKHTGVKHNLHFELDGADAATRLTLAPDTQTITFTAPTKTGTYTYLCDAHPDVMRGKLVVE